MVNDVNKVVEMLRSWKADRYEACKYWSTEYENAPKRSYARRVAKAEWDYVSAQYNTIDEVIVGICELN